MNKSVKASDSGKNLTTWHPTVPTWTRPVIVDSFVDDDGETMHILASGNICPQIKFDAIWNPARGKVLPEHTKDPVSSFLNPNGRR